ncbi:MAG: ComEC/Rec2 family competence protein, partial [Rhodospirillales bacterium]|nr:ComEC/Rec2 family competence protein [Rhodospirillales bacterium]
GLVLLGLGLLWLSLWRSRWRLAGLAFLLLGAISPALNHPPNILVSGDQRLLGLTAPDGSLWLSSGRVGRFAADVWLRRRAQAEPYYWPPNGEGHWLRCDSLGCRYRYDGQTAALALTPEALQEAYRRPGLAHLLAISGLHVGLIATIFFFSLRALLALSPSLALNWPIKKIAALVTAVLLPFYLPMVGASVPTQRACLMTLVVLAAVLLDRRAISMRLVAVAALVVLALAPESLLTASFQLSFAAVTALVAAYEVWQLRRPGWKGGAGLRSRLLLYFLGVLASSMIATLSTAPFAAYHFHRLALYGLAANLLAVPLTAFWIMPFCLLSYLLLPLGLEQFALTPLGWGLEVLNTTAQGFSALPGATLNLPAMPLWGLVL